MATNKKQIKDFTLLTHVIGNQDNLLVQRDSGTTFRTHISNLPFTNKDYTSAGLASISYVNSTVNNYLLKSNYKNYTTAGLASASSLNNYLLKSNYKNYTTAGLATTTYVDNKDIDWSKVVNTPTTLAGYGITDGGGGSSTNGFISLSYAELVALQSTHGLSAGSFYMINDYRTCYVQPDYDYNWNALDGTYKQSAIEPIIVLALSNNTVSSSAYQPKYPNDRIQYDINVSILENGSNALGLITERIDEYNNRTDYDHRTILFKRYKTYFVDYDEELNGTITVNNYDVVGINTNFTTQLTEGTVIFIHDNIFTIETIIDNSSMGLSGHNGIYVSNEKYYVATPEIDGESSNIPYTHTQMTGGNIQASTSSLLMNGAVVSGTANFGAGSQYFTNLYPGLFVMAAYGIQNDEFSVEGNLGADGSGLQDHYSYSTSFMSIDYTIFVKRVWGAGDPSVNHIIIMNTSSTSGLIHTIGSNTDSDLQRISNIHASGATQIHYLLTSKQSGQLLLDTEIEAIVSQYLYFIHPNIQNTLDNINGNYQFLTQHVPNIYYFNDIGGVGYINDGSGDMYDSGNYLYTNLGQKWTSYEVRQNNILSDTYFRELTTFQYETEIEQYDSVQSKNNYIGNYSNVYNGDYFEENFKLANNVFGTYSYMNKIGDGSMNNTVNGITFCTINDRFSYNIVYYNMEDNIIGKDFNENIITSDFYDNIIGNDFNNNKIHSDFYRNQIGYDFEDNTITYEFYHNIIGNDFDNNRIYNEFYHNRISDSFNNNTNYNDFSYSIIGSECNNNIWRANFYNNRIGDGCNSNESYFNLEYNNFGHTFQSNIFGSNGSYTYTVQHNTIDNRCKGNNFKGDVYQNEIGVDFFSNNIGESFDNNVFGHFTIFNDLGNNFNNNTISNGFQSNTIGNNFENNIIEENFSGNQIGEYFKGNHIGYNYYNNDILSNFNTNIIGNGFFSNNIANNFQFNKFAHDSYNNIIIDNFQFNEFAAPIQNTDFSLSSHVYGDYNCNIIKGMGGTLYLNYFDGTSGIYTPPTA